jgi:hypothetical protein
MASSSQIEDSSRRGSTIQSNEISQLEDELSSLCVLLSELRSQDGAHLSGTSAEQDSNVAQVGKMGIDIQDAEVQALLEKLEQLHGFANGVEDRMDTLLAKLDDMLGVLDNGEMVENVEEGSSLLEGPAEKDSDEAKGAQVGQPLPEPQASPEA